MRRTADTRIEEAASAVELALVRLRSDPRPLLHYKEKALALADAIARHNPALARRMFEALRKPFAVGELHEQRLLQSADLTRQTGFRDDVPPPPSMRLASASPGVATSSRFGVIATR